MKHYQAQHTTSTTHPIFYAAARRLLRSLRASPRVSSEVGYRPTRWRDAHQAASLPKKGWVVLPAYRQYRVLEMYNILVHPVFCLQMMI